MFLLLEGFNTQLMSYKALILAFTLDIFDEKGVICVEDEKLQLPVDVRCSKTSVLKLSSVLIRYYELISFATDVSSSFVRAYVRFIDPFHKWLPI